MKIIQIKIIGTVYKTTFLKMTIILKQKKSKTKKAEKGNKWTLKILMSLKTKMSLG